MSTFSSAHLDPGDLAPGGDVQMAEYRLYVLHRFTGRIVRAETLQAVDDTSAVDEIQQRGSPEAMELWCGARKVTRLDPEPDTLA